MISFRYSEKTHERIILVRIINHYLLKKKWIKRNPVRRIEEKWLERQILWIYGEWPWICCQTYMLLCRGKLLLGKQCHKWPGIRTVGMVKTYKRNNKTGEETTLMQYFITSLGKDTEAITNFKKWHWEIENGLHCTLDVIFGEDLSRKRWTRP